MAERQPAFWIVDTNVLSRPTGKDGEPDDPAARWIRTNAALIRINAVTIAEVRRGLVLERQRIERLRDLRARRRDQEILAVKEAWYRQLVSQFADRVLPIDLAVAERWADVSVRFPSVRDGDKAIIAAALVHGCGVATRNRQDFQAAGLPLVDPFDPSTWWENDRKPARRGHEDAT